MILMFKKECQYRTKIRIVDRRKIFFFPFLRTAIREEGNFIYLNSTLQSCYESNFNLYFLCLEILTFHINPLRRKNGDISS